MTAYSGIRLFVLHTLSSIEQMLGVLLCYIVIMPREQELPGMPLSRVIPNFWSKPLASADFLVPAARPASLRLHRELVSPVACDDVAASSSSVGAMITKTHCLEVFFAARVSITRQQISIAHHFSAAC